MQKYKKFPVWWKLFADSGEVFSMVDRGRGWSWSAMVGFGVVGEDDACDDDDEGEGLVPMEGVEAEPEGDEGGYDGDKVLVDGEELAADHADCGRGDNVAVDGGEEDDEGEGEGWHERG